MTRQAKRWPAAGSPTRPYFPWFAALLLLFAFGERASAGQQGATSYRIAGVVVDASTGWPVAHAEVSILVRNDELIDVTADESGRFVFDGLEGDKKYSLQAGAPGYVRERLNQHWGFYSTAVTVGAGIDSEHIVFRVHPQAVIYGAVTDEQGEAVRNARVMLFRMQAGWGRRTASVQGHAQTNDLGEFRFAHLLPGKYYVAVQAEPWYAQHRLNYLAESERTVSRSQLSGSKSNAALDVVYPITFYPGVTDERSAADLNVSAGEKREADIQLAPIPAVHVRLTNLPAEANNIRVSVVHKVFGSWQEGGTAYGQTSSGEYEITGFSPGGALDIDTGAGQDGRRIVEDNFENSETVDFAGAVAPATVSGQVIFQTAMPTPVRGRVNFVSWDSGAFSTAVQKDGTFSVSGVRPGTYSMQVFIFDEGDVDYVQAISATGAKASRGKITIESPGDVQLNITMGRGLGEISGVAKLAGKPCAGAMVLLVPQSGDNLGEDVRIDQSDSDGGFNLARVWPGEYILLAIEDGWDLEWRDAKVLKAYRGKGVAVRVAPNDNQKLTVDVQQKLTDGGEQ